MIIFNINVYIYIYIFLYIGVAVRETNLSYWARWASGGPRVGINQHDSRCHQLHSTAKPNDHSDITDSPDTNRLW